MSQELEQKPAVVAEQQQPQQETEAAAATNEPVAPASGESGLVNIAPTLFTLISFGVLVLLVVATPITWFYRKTPASYTRVSIWSTTAEFADPTIASTEVLVVDMTCSTLRARFRAIEAFAILSIVAAALTTALGLASRVAGKALTPGLALALVTVASTVTTWAMAVRLYYQSNQCALASYSQQKYEFDAGLALFVTASVLALIAAAVAFVEPKLPAIVPAAAVDRAVSALFVVLNAVAFAFVVIGTPTTWFYQWSASLATYDTLSLWKQKIYTNGVLTTSTDLRKVNCGDFAKVVKFGESFQIIAIAATLAAVVVGALALKGAAGKRVLAVFGFAAFLAALLASAAGLSLYYREFCGANTSLRAQAYQVTGGAAIFIAAFVLSLAATVIVVLAGVSQYLSSAEARKGGNSRWTAAVFLFAVVVSLTFETIAANIAVFTNAGSDSNNYVRVTFWEVQRKVAGAVSTQAFTCEPIWARLNGAGALNIIAIALLLLALILGALQFTSASLRRGASIVALLASVAQLVSWGLAATVYTTVYCGTKFYGNGYTIDAGLGLVIAAWCVTLVSALLNFFVGPVEAE